VFESSLELVVSRDRLACPNCRPRREPLDWLAPYARVTRRLAESVARLRTVTALVHAARWFGFSWRTVRQIDRQHRERTCGPVDLTGVTVIAIDAFAIQKGPVTQRRCCSPSASACCGSVYAFKDDPKQLWR
jgi:transposase